MSPLAYRIAKQLWTSPKHRDPFDDRAGLLKSHAMEDVHCFDMTGVEDLMDDLGEKWHDASIENGRWADKLAIDKRLAFLPAPKTWIEYCGAAEEPKATRLGLLLEEVEDTGLALCTIVSQSRGLLRSFKAQMVLALHTRDDFALKKNPELEAEANLPKGWQTTCLFRIYASLALINSPRIIGRRTHMPHRALIKKFAVGKFPLHAWTEIRLEVNKPVEIDDGAPHETHLTGRRALHFCRAHIRIRLGQLEYVTSHWRGDPAIGIKQSRYAIVKAPNTHRQPFNHG